jgi:hypothetical protein
VIRDEAREHATEDPGDAQEHAPVVVDEPGDAHGLGVERYCFITAWRRNPEQNSIATMIQMTRCENIAAPPGPASSLRLARRGVPVSKSLKPACAGESRTKKNVTSTQAASTPPGTQNAMA